MTREPLVKRYQMVISAAVVSVSLLTTAFVLGAHISHLAYQHDEIIRTLDKQTEQQNRLLDIYLKGCAR